MPTGAPGRSNDPDCRSAAPRTFPLAGKLRPPLATAFEVQRTEVCERIFNADAARLVLLRAPAGFGKTTVMLQVRRRFEETGLPQAWLTLDRADNDVDRFLAALTASLEPLIPALRKLQRPTNKGRTNSPSP